MEFIIPQCLCSANANLTLNDEGKTVTAQEREGLKCSCTQPPEGDLRNASSRKQLKSNGRKPDENHLNVNQENVFVRINSNYSSVCVCVGLCVCVCGCGCS